MSTPETKAVQEEDFSTYLVNAADKLQAKLDEVGQNMEKQFEEMTKRIDTLQRSIEQMEKDSTKSRVE